VTLPDLGFTLDRIYAAPPERVWSYFTDPELMTRWFCPNPDLEITCDLDARPGGGWRVVMGEWVVGGGYVEVEPPKRLVFTFDWEHDEEEPTTVIVEIVSEGDVTRLVLAHEETAGEESGHENGWLLSFVRLDALLS
jgi:uncharacterized protein YndB with AHSA1/START domain